MVIDVPFDGFLIVIIVSPPVTYRLSWISVRNSVIKSSLAVNWLPRKLPWHQMKN